MEIFGRNENDIRMNKMDKYRQNCTNHLDRMTGGRY
jgi:hypothetical protein